MSSPRLKPLVRWTVGNVHRRGVEILKESLLRTTKALGLVDFDWMICYNNIAAGDLQFAHAILPGVQLVEQRWEDCAIPARLSSPRAVDGTLRSDNHRCGGSLWKLTPARMRLAAHEIILDNDVVLCRRPAGIDEFLAGGRAMMAVETVRFLGRYDHLLPRPGGYNSGLIGLPPGYDFGAALRAAWATHGANADMTYADEQGLVAYVVGQTNPVWLSGIVHLHDRGTCHYFWSDDCYSEYRFTGQEDGLHFLQANRHDVHIPWGRYKTGLIKCL